MDCKNVEVLIASGVKTLRSGLYNALKSIGVGRVVEVSTPEEADYQIRNEDFDVLVLAAEIGDTFMGDMVREIRHGRLGSHPFPIIIMLAGSTDADDIHKLAGCGPDAALLTATAANQIGPRLSALALEDRKFVVDYHYTGPERRKKNRGDEITCHTQDAPNPLAAKINRKNLQHLRRDIKTAAEALNGMKIDRLALQLRWFVEGILKASKAEPIDGDTMRTDAMNLVGLSKDLKIRTKGWLASPISDLVDQMATAAEDLGRVGGSAGKPEILNLLRTGQKVAQEVRRVTGG